jgi:hypothetical protein
VLAPLKEKGFGPRVWFILYCWMRDAVRRDDGAAVVTYVSASNFDRLRPRDIQRVITTRGWGVALADGRCEITAAGREAMRAVATAANAMDSFPPESVVPEGC